MLLVKKRKLKIQEVTDALRQHIKGGTFAPDSAVASARELSTLLNVPLSTINRAIYQLVEEGWLYRQHGRGTFVKSREKHVRPWRIGFFERIDEPLYTNERYYVQELYEKPVVAELEQSGCSIERFGREDLNSTRRCAEIFPQLDAIIINSALLKPPAESNLYRFGKPILIYRNLYVHDFPSNQVIPDWTMGIRQMLNHIDLKHYQHFILLKTKNQVNNDVISNTFCQQAELFGVAREQIECIEFDYNFTSDEHLNGLKFGMNMKIRPDTFIFSTSDFLTFGVIDAWKERGIHPGEIPIVGCFNMEGNGWQPFDAPLITTIDLDRHELARRGVKLLKQALENDDECPHILRIPTQLIIRQTAFS